MARPLKFSKVQQMRTQEEIIQRKKLEILEKQRKQEIAKQLAAVAAGEKITSSSTETPNSGSAVNTFSNDGSFLENFKKISEQVQQQMKHQSPPVPAVTEETPEATQETMPLGSEFPVTFVPNVYTSPPPSVHPAAFSSNIASVSFFNVPTNSQLPTPSVSYPVVKADEPGPLLLPELDIRNAKDEKLPTTLVEFIDCVAVIGDIYEEKMCLRKNDVPSAFWFLFDKESDEYKRYRAAVLDRRKEKGLHLEPTEDQYDPVNQFLENETVLNEEKATVDPEKVVQAPLEKVQKNQFASIDKSDSSDSDTECWREAKERNLKSLKRKALYPNKQIKSSADSTDSEDEENNRNITGEDSGSSQSAKPHLESSESSSSVPPPRRKKSRWGDQVPVTATPPSLTPIQPAIAKGAEPPKLTAITRRDPALIQYALQNFGSTNLSEEDWKKAEEHFKINLLYQDMLRKRQEIDCLSKQGKFKYEYDSDEDVTGGTWEHKLRLQEMEATQLWADALTKQAQDKHHIGDFLPPEELKKFMEKYEAQRSNKQPDLSDYKEYKLKEDNLGFQMLQKLGWKEGTGLGASSSGIVEPVNKAAQRSQNQGLGVQAQDAPDADDNEYDAYRKRMMLAYRFRPNPLNNPRRAYY